MCVGVISKYLLYISFSMLFIITITKLYRMYTDDVKIFLEAKHFRTTFVYPMNKIKLF